MQQRIVIVGGGAAGLALASKAVIVNQAGRARMSKKKDIKCKPQ